MKQLPTNRNNEIKPFETGISKDQRLLQAHASIKVSELGQNMNPLAESLRVAYVLIGLKPDNQPSEAERMVLRQFICQNFHYLSCDDIKEAFTMVVKGDLGKIEHFQSFSCEYFAKVVKAYEQHLNKAVCDAIAKKRKEDIINDVQPDEETKLKKLHAFIMSDIAVPYTKFCDNGEVNIPKYSINYIYQVLWSIGLIKLDDKQKDEIRLIATTRVSSEYEKRKSALFTSLADRIDFERQDKASHIKKACRLITIELTFKRLKDEGYTFRY